MDSRTLNKFKTGKARGLSYEHELQEKREQKLWKSIVEPHHLESVLHSHSKTDLDKIRKNLDLKGISGLNKGDLIKELVRAIPNQLFRILSRFDKERYVLFKNIVKHSGKLPLPRNVSVKKVEALMAWGVIFPIHLEGGKGLTVPIEIIEQFHALEGQELQKVIDRNTEWIQLTQGCLYYYGVMNTSLLVDRVSDLMNREIDFLEFLYVFSSASDYYKQIAYSGYGLVDKRVIDQKEIFAEIEKRPSIDYFPFTKQQLLKAGKPEYIEKTREMQRLIQFLQQYYDLTAEERDDLAEQLNIMIFNNGSLNQAVEYFQLRLEFPDMEFFQDLAYYLTELFNHSRRWILKGYTPREISQGTTATSTVLGSQSQPLSNIIDFKSRKAIGRNDPCPCGSGKKYKKCCGKA
ncbi:YecA family protein [Robertmurraya korlensis]|uniref:YecA family protein n=1 Tax=Robertmurraya korlensis TaxID=519977 RepID=UPI000824A048|nr:SEC-C metal-binding domain-containing protein [Robertmurraya korlensis]